MPATFAGHHPTRHQANLHAAVAALLFIGLTFLAWLVFVWPRPAPFAGGTVWTYGILSAALVTLLAWLVATSGEEDDAED